jgi:hypothetical protein
MILVHADLLLLNRVWNALLNLLFPSVHSHFKIIRVFRGEKRPVKSMLQRTIILSSAKLYYSDIDCAQEYADPPFCERQ